MIIEYGDDDGNDYDDGDDDDDGSDDGDDNEVVTGSKEMGSIAQSQNRHDCAI